MDKGEDNDLALGGNEAMEMKDSPLHGDPPSFDDVLQELGAFGRFQRIQLAVGLIGSFMTLTLTMTYVFLGHEPHHVCNPVNETSLLLTHGLTNDSSAKISYESCDIRISANRSGRYHDVMTLSCPQGRNFFDAVDSTFLSYWDLVCESMGRAEFSHVTFTIGQMIGGVIVTTIADYRGRKPVIVVSALFAFVTEICLVFAPNIYVIYAMRLFSGLFSQGVNCCFFVIGMELVIPKHRQVYGVVICCLWMIQQLFVGAAAFFLQNYSWRYFQGAVAAVGILIFVYPIFLHESPRWLATTGRFEECLKILRVATKMNRKDYRKIKSVFLSFAGPNESNNSIVKAEEKGDGFHKIQSSCNNSKTTKDNVWTLLTHKKFFKVTLTAWFLSITHDLTFFGLFMTSSTLVGNRFLNYSLMALVDIPGNLLILYCMTKMKRKTVLRIFLSMAATCLLASTLLASLSGSADHNVWSTVLFIAGKFAIGASFNVLYILIPEIFPTSLRVSGVGSCYAVEKVGRMVSPFLRPLSTVVVWGPGVIFVSLCAVALALTRILPETKDTNLPATLTDAAPTQDGDSGCYKDGTEFGDGEETV